MFTVRHDWLFERKGRLGIVSSPCCCLLLWRLWNNVILTSAKPSVSHTATYSTTVNTYMSSWDVSVVSQQLQTQQSTHCTLRKNTPTYGPNSAVDSTLNSRNDHSHRGGAWGGICNFSTSKIDWNVSKIQSVGGGEHRGVGGLPCHCWGAWGRKGRGGGNGHYGDVRLAGQCEDGVGGAEDVIGPWDKKQRGDGKYSWRAA